MKKVAVFINSLRGGGAERIVSYLLNEGYSEFEFHLILFQKEIEYSIPEDKIKIFELEPKATLVYINILNMRPLASRLKG